MNTLITPAMALIEPLLSFYKEGFDIEYAIKQRNQTTPEHTVRVHSC